MKIPVIEMPAGSCRPLSAAECLLKAEENDGLAEISFGRWKGYHEREAAEWRVLAERRA